MDDKKHLQHSRKMKNIEKMIRKLHDQRLSKKINVQQYSGEYQAYNDRSQHIQHTNSIQQQKNDQNLFLSQQEEVDFHLFTKVIENIQTIIETNELNVQGLERKNQLLIKHMDNLKKLFIKSQTQTLMKPYSEVQLKGVVNDHELSISENKSHQMIPTWKKPKFSSKQNEKNKKPLNIARKQVKTNQNDTIWHNEQQNVRIFLQSWLKKNIKQNTSSSSKMIQRRIIFHLYLKWKEVQNLTKNNENELSQAQIQQILTIQMRSAFNCTCTTRGYEGITFIKRSQTNSSTIQVQKQAKNILQEKNKNEIKQQQSVEEKDLEEEFSYEIQSEEGKFKEDQCYI